MKNPFVWSATGRASRGRTACSKTTGACEAGILGVGFGCLLAVLVGAAEVAAEADRPPFYHHLRVSDPPGEIERLRSEGFRVRNHEPLRLALPLDWAADPFGDSNWRYQLNAMYPLAPVFQQLERQYSGDLHAFARAVFLDWIRFNIEEDRDHPFRWNDMATGIRASYLAQLLWYERLHPSDAAADYTRLLKAAESHLAELSEPEKLAASNHAIFQVVGIAALCQVHGLSGCDSAMRYARSAYALVFWRQFAEDGMHLEHSPEYHLLALNAFDRVEASGLLTLQDDARAVLSLAKRNLQWLIHPDGGFAQIGDTEARKAAGARRFDPAAAWLTSAGRLGERPQHGIRVFPASGYASIRASHQSGADTFLLVTAAHHSPNHKHLDSGSFEWSDRSQRVLVDSGKWSYERGPYRDYFVGQLAHNVLVTEGVDPSVREIPLVPPEISGTGLEGIYVISVRQSVSRRLRDADHVRLLVMKPGEWLVVLDEISELLFSSQTQWFQFAPTSSVERTAGGFEVRFPGVEEHISGLFLNDVEVVQLRRGEREPVIGWYSSAYGQLDPAWQLGVTRSGRIVKLSTLFRWRTGSTGDSKLRKEASGMSARRAPGETFRFCWLEGDDPAGVILRRSAEAWSAESCG